MRMCVVNDVMCSLQGMENDFCGSKLLETLSSGILHVPNDVNFATLPATNCIERATHGECSKLFHNGWLLFMDVVKFAIAKVKEFCLSKMINVFCLNFILE